MQHSVFVTVGIALLCLAGCGVSVEQAQSGAASGAGGSGGDATSGTGGSGGDTVCGGLGGLPCPAHTYCVWADGSCGGADQTGICEPVPLDCPMTPGPSVCGCDGKAYPSACFAALVGVDIPQEGACAGQFACGPMVCQLTTQYCLYAPDIQQPDQPAYSCMPLPAACGASPSCDCLAAECGMCSGQGATGLTKSCPGLG